MILPKYDEIFRELNSEIGEFNSLLAEDVKIPFLDSSNPESCSVIANIPWDSQVWPCKDFPGVYILCGCQESEPGRLGAYIGKASLSNIGNRLWSHLNPHRSTDIYKLNDASGVPFVIEAIVAIGLQDPRMRVLASALEEALITGVKYRIHLLNGTGNSRN
jgi:hypothetical protein